MDEKRVNEPLPEEQLPQEEIREELTEAEKLNKKVKKREKGVKAYQYFILRLLVFLFILWLLFFVFIGLTHMPNGDMYPRVDSGDLLMFYRLDKDPKAQDIIVFEKLTPLSPKKQLYVARVVAVAGDTVEITDGDRLIVNGNGVVETNIFYPTPRYEGEGFPEYPLTLEAGECFVLVDYRNGGTDSRYFGPVSQDEILGTLITIIRRNNL